MTSAPRPFARAFGLIVKDSGQDVKYSLEWPRILVFFLWPCPRCQQDPEGLSQATNTARTLYVWRLKGQSHRWLSPNAFLLLVPAKTKSEGRHLTALPTFASSLHNQFEHLAFVLQQTTRILKYSNRSIALICWLSPQHNNYGGPFPSSGNQLLL